MQIKLNYSPKIYEVVSVLDPAIDHEKSDLKKYMETRDLEHIKFKEGSTPTKIFMKNIRQDLFQKLLEQPQITYFSFAVEKILNPKEFMFSHDVDIIDDGLNIWEPSDVISLPTGGQVKYCKDAGDIFSITFLNEMGFVIMGKASCPRGTRPTYQELPALITLSRITNT